METRERIAISDICVIEVLSKKHRVKHVAGRDFYALSYRLEGKVTLESNGDRVLSVPDSITFTPKGMSYRTAVREDTRMIVVHFRLVKDIDFRVPAVINTHGNDLRARFERLAAAYRIGGGNDFECMSLFYALLADLERLANPITKGSRCALEARERIDALFANADLSILEIAESAGVSDSYLRRSFKEAYGESPVEYLLRVRIQNAKMLLESEFFTVAEIATRCGFHSASYFVQAFHAQTGETPGTYRKRKYGR